MKIDKSNMPSDPELVVEYIDQLKADNKRLKEEVKNRKQPKILFDGNGLMRVLDHWTWGSLITVSCMCGFVLLVVNIWPSVYETGRFYLTHRMHNYTPHVPIQKELDNCYQVNKEVENSTDDIMTDCFRDKDEAYQVANEFANDWKKLKDKAEAESNE